MYSNQYLNAYNPQMSIDRINSQMAELEQMKQRLQQPAQQPTPTNLTQNFQLAPTSRDVIRYANSMDDVQKEMIIGETPFFSKDMSIVWVKNPKGEIKTYELNEILPLDEKDFQIKYLQEQIEELKKEIKKNEQFFTNVNEASTSETNGSIGATTKKSKSTSLSTISKCKEK